MIIRHSMDDFLTLYKRNNIINFYNILIYCILRLMACRLVTS